MGHAFTKPAEAVAHVAEPILRSRQGAGVVELARQRNGAFEPRHVAAQRQRIEDRRHAELVDQQTPPHLLLAVEFRQAIDRLDRDLVLDSRPIGRERRHGLVAGAFGIIGRAIPMAGSSAMIGQCLERIFAIRRLGLRQQRDLDPLVQRLARMQADGIVDGIAGDAVLETESASRRIGVEEIRVGQRLHRGRIGRLATGRDQQSARHHIADHRRGADDVGLVGRQARQSRGDQRRQPALRPAAFDRRR